MPSAAKEKRGQRSAQRATVAKSSANASTIWLRFFTLERLLLKFGFDLKRAIGANLEGVPKCPRSENLRQ
jgi:hypothetical protein